MPPPLAAAHLGAVLQEAFRFAAERLPQYERGPQAILLVGHSASRGRMAALQADSQGVDAPVEVQDLEWGAAPDCGLAPLAAGMLKTDDGALELARAQHAAHGSNPYASVGGRLIVARLTSSPRARITIDDLGPI